jgi:hypothetical protein
MARKRKVAKDDSHNALPEYRILIELARRARHEVQDLLKAAEKRDIGKGTLNKGLKNVEVPMEQMVEYIEKTLDDVSRLRRRIIKKVDLEELEIDLKEVGSRLKLMFDHSNEW